MKALQNLQILMKYVETFMPGVSLPNYVINGEEKLIKGRTHYVNVWLNTLIGGNLLNSNTKILPGVSSIDGTALPNGIDFLVTAVCADFETSTAGLQAGAGITAAAFNDIAPLCFANGDITINQGAELFAAPGCDVTNPKASTGPDDDYRVLETPIYIRGGVNFNINALLSAGVPVAADMGCRFKLRGIEFPSLDRASGSRS